MLVFSVSLMPFMCDSFALRTALSDLNDTLGPQSIELLGSMLPVDSLTTDHVLIPDTKMQGLVALADLAKGKVLRMDNDVELAGIPFTKQHLKFAPFVKAARVASDALNACKQLPDVPIEFL